MEMKSINKYYRSVIKITPELLAEIKRYVTGNYDSYSILIKMHDGQKHDCVDFDKAIETIAKHEDAVHKIILCAQKGENKLEMRFANSSEVALEIHAELDDVMLPELIGNFIDRVEDLSNAGEIETDVSVLYSSSWFLLQLALLLKVRNSIDELSQYMMYIILGCFIAYLSVNKLVDIICTAKCGKPNEQDKLRFMFSHDSEQRYKHKYTCIHVQSIVKNIIGVVVLAGAGLFFWLG